MTDTATPPDQGYDATYDRLPPQNLDAERCVLGSCLLLNDAIDDVAEFLRADHFYGEAHGTIFAAIHHLYESGVRGIDAVTLAEELEKRKQLAGVGGPAYLVEILESVPHAAHAKYYASIVRDKWIQRQLIYTSSGILREAYDQSCDTPSLLEKAEREVFRILEQQETAQKLAIGDILMDAWDALNSRIDSGGGMSGLTTGFVDMDGLTSGFRPSELVILAARPSMGKTAMVCHWAEAAAVEANRGVLIFSLEMSKVELAERFLCIRSRINGDSIRSGNLDEHERRRLMEVSQELSQAPLFIDDTPARSMTQIASLSRRMKRQHDIGLVIIDYLQLIEPESRREPREQQVAQITRRLKFLSKELHIPVVALAQLNRGVETRKEGDKRPRMADLRESGSIEQDADMVLLLHRPEVYEPLIENKGRAELIIAKNRNGRVGTVHLTWRSEVMRFENSSNEPPPIVYGGFDQEGSF